ncbi:MAG: hypothetical protein ABFD96_16825 [Armatimonadia bacterium]
MIDIELWNNANWQGMIFLTSPEDGAIPLAAPLFGDRAAGTAIFQAWRATLGEEDEQNRLRFAIVRGVDSSNPHHYAVVFGPNPEVVFQGAEQNRYALFVSRVHTMTPASSQNLNRFLEAYEREGAYALVPAFATAGQPEVDWDLQIGKTNLVAKDAWQMGRNDLDASAINPDISPVIPEGVEQAPVLELIDWLRECRDQGNNG